MKLACEHFTFKRLSGGKLLKITLISEISTENATEIRGEIEFEIRVWKRDGREQK